MLERDLDLNLLSVLRALFEEMNVSRAARRLRLSQPAVSASLARLRRYFNDELFFRAGQGLLPTAFAEGLREAVLTSMDLIDQRVKHGRRFDPRKAQTTFTLSTADIGEAVCMRPLLSRLKAEAPGCELRFVAAAAPKLSELMSRGEVDLAVGYFPDLTGKGIHSEQLRLEPLTCLLRREHPLVRGRLTLDTFRQLEHLVVTHEGRGQDDYERIVLEKKVGRRVRARICHFTNAPALLAETDLIAVVPHALGVLYSKTYGLQSLPLPFSVPHMEIKLFWHQRVHRDMATAWLRRVISSIFQDMSPHDPPPTVSGSRARSRVPQRRSGSKAN